MWNSFYEPIKALSTTGKGLLLTAIFEYQTTGNIITLPIDVKMAFLFIKTQLDIDNKKYSEEVEKRRAAGSLGGKARAKKQSQTNQASAKNEKQVKQSQTNQADNENVYDNSGFKEKDTLTSIQKESVRPTLDEVRIYCKERGGIVNPEKWFNHYQSNGWKVGKNPMKDWKAAVRKWEYNEDSKRYAVKGVVSGTYSSEVPL